MSAPRTYQKAIGQKIIGLTGSIGMGKSTVAGMFADLGVPVFDADAEVRRMQGPGGELVEVIERAFPGSTGSKGVNREALGAQVFADEEARARLEAIVHPAVSEKRAAFMAAHTDAPLLLFDIPLLFERSVLAGIDHIVVVSAPAARQAERVLAREGMTADKLERILAIQMPDSEKRKRADTIIDTGVSLEETRQCVAALIEELAGE